MSRDWTSERRNSALVGVAISGPNDPFFQLALWLHENVSDRSIGDHLGGALTPELAWTQRPTMNLGTWQAVVVGESHYQEALEVLADGRNGLGTRRRLFTATLVTEPNNAYDSNAVQVRAGDQTIGYIAKEYAVKYGRVVKRLERDGQATTCRAELTGGWNRANGDRGHIGVRICTGSQVTVWNGKTPFLARLPFYERVPMLPLAGLPAELAPPDKALVTLAPVQGGIAVRHGDTWVGHIIQRPDLATFVGRLVSLQSPATAELRLRSGQPVIEMADPDAVADRMFALAGDGLKEVRRSNAPTGHWACTRCGLLWSDPRQPPRGWYDVELSEWESPHVCPGDCGSYAYTHPF